MINSRQSSVVSRQSRPRGAGFTLIEIVVSVALFSVVVVVAVGAIIAVSTLEHRARTMQTVMDNLGFTLESLAREVRIGSNYHCDLTSGSVSSPQDCESNPANSFAFLSSDGVTLIEYRLVDNAIERSEDAGANFDTLTALEISITSLQFFVVGTKIGIQPKVLVAVTGNIIISGTESTPFSIQTTVIQRRVDS